MGVFMAVPVMQVRIMWMGMRQWHVPVPMRMRFAGGHSRPMLVLVVSVMDVAMLMLHRLVGMLVIMPL